MHWKKLITTWIRKSPGRYKVIVTFKGNYSGRKSKTLYFTILPKAPTNVNAELRAVTGGYDDITVTWKKPSGGATGYAVYMKKGSGSYVRKTYTTKTTYTIKNLSDGVKYTFKIVPYYKSKTSKTKYLSTKYATDYVYTLKKVTLSKVAKSGSKVKVTWKNINGETGYQISKATKKSKTSIAATYKTTRGKSKLVTAKKGKTYYYKVRAYKKIKVNGKTKTVYGPWSTVKSFKRK